MVGLVIWGTGPALFSCVLGVCFFFENAEVRHAGFDGEHLQLALCFFVELGAVQGACGLVDVEDEFRLEGVFLLVAVGMVLIVGVVQDVLKGAIGVVRLVGGRRIVVLYVLEQLAQGDWVQPQIRQLGRQAVDAFLELGVGDG